MIPALKTGIPGPNSKRLLADLRRVECNHVTYADRDFPVFIKKAKGANVWDADGNRFLDLTSFFGVSFFGHGNADIKKAMLHQINDGWHGMGDVHPPVQKSQAAALLTELLPNKLSKIYFANSGSEAVETALKTACIKTRRPEVIAFEGAYHGLGYGALQVTHRKFFKAPFKNQINFKVSHLPFVSQGEGDKKRQIVLRQLESRLIKKKTACVIIEPVQGRAGVRPCDQTFLKTAAALCKKTGTLLVFDEIFTGCGRLGDRFAFETYKLIPDLLCLGKALSGGFPISAVAGTKEVMAAWGPSKGEARHTWTHLGNPLGAAMIRASLKILKKPSTMNKVRSLGALIESEAHKLMQSRGKAISAIRGRGLMWGIEMSSKKRSLGIMKQLLKKGVLILPSGEDSRVISLTPPMTVTPGEIKWFFKEFDAILSQ